MSEGLLDRVPPHDSAAEIAVLGACMLDNEACTLLCGVLSRKDFYKTAHGEIWSVIARLHQIDQRPDLVMVTQWLMRLKKIDAVGGPAYLREIIDAVPSSANCEQYAEIVRDMSLQRSLLAACLHGMEDVFNSGMPPQEMLAKAVDRVTALAGVSVDAPVAMKEVMHKIVDNYETGRFTEFLPTGLQELDDKLCGGLPRGTVTVLAGRPGMGKSSLAAWMAKGIADDGNETLFVTLEMTEEGLAVRWIAAELCVPSHVISTGRGVDAARVTEAAAKLASMQMRLSGAETIVAIKAALGNASLLVIDYLQLMETPKSRDSMTDRIGELTRQIKMLSRKRNIAVLLLSQLNREIERRTDKRPMLADLRSSGNIEQDADSVCFLYRPAYYDDKDYKDEDGFEPVVLTVAKQRHGPTGVVETLRANLTTMRWKTSTIPF